MKKPWFVFLLLTSLTVGAQTAISGQPVVADIDAAKTGAPISSYLYGQFIEHAWTEDHRALTVAVLNLTDVEQPLKLNITGADLTGKGTLWRLASAEAGGQNPSIRSVLVDAIPKSMSLPQFSVSIYELESRN